MRRKIILIFTMLCSMMLFVACDKENHSENSVSRNTEDSVQQAVGNEGTQKDEADKDPNPFSFPQFAGELDFTYVADTDCQSALGTYPMKAYTPDGIYSYSRLSGNTALQFYDYASGETVYVCSKSNCSHGNPGCDAYFDEETYSFGTSFLWYYEGSLYIPALDGDDLYLERISPDGSIRERSCTIMRLNRQTVANEDGTVSEQIEYPYLQLHRGYLYISTYSPGVDHVELLRVKVDSEEEAETLFSYSSNYPVLYRIKPYGRYVLFQFGDFLDAAGTDIAVGICAYDTEGDGTISLVRENAYRDYTVIDDQLFYFDGEDNIYRMDLGSMKTELYYKNEVGDFESALYEYEGSLVYQICRRESMTESFTQLILDQDGNVVDTRTSEEENLVSPY